MAVIAMNHRPLLVFKAFSDSGENPEKIVYRTSGRGDYRTSGKFQVLIHSLSTDFSQNRTSGMFLPDIGENFTGHRGGCLPDIGDADTPETRANTGFQKP
jgi:hypothetical protein